MVRNTSLLFLVTFASVSVAFGKVSVLQDDLSSCRGRCNISETNPNAPCQCNTRCSRYGDCCADYVSLCLSQGSCVGRCDSQDPNSLCQCNDKCERFGDCCLDYSNVCELTRVPVTDAELSALSEQLLSLDSENNVAPLVKVNLDKKPLLTVWPAAYSKNTIAKFVALLDNYVADVSKPEIVTAEKLVEEKNFLDAVFDTLVMKKAQEFLVAKSLPSGRDNFYQIWYGLYSRSGSTLGSSGFEHIYLGELNSGVSGFHNWIQFAKEEAAGRVVYGNHTNYVTLGKKGSIIEFGFTWQGQTKPVSSMYIGTSPELELALNTVCYHARSNALCNVTLSGKKIQIQTYDISCMSNKTCVASGYPVLGPASNSSTRVWNSILGLWTLISLSLFILF